MDKVQIVYRITDPEQRHVDELVKSLYSIGATKCETSFDGAIQVVTATLPTLNEFDA